MCILGVYIKLKRAVQRPHVRVETGNIIAMTRSVVVNFVISR